MSNVASALFAVMMDMQKAGIAGDAKENMANVYAAVMALRDKSAAAKLRELACNMQGTARRCLNTLKAAKPGATV